MMSQSTVPRKPVEHWEQVRDEWIAAVKTIVEEASAWAESQGWAVRIRDKAITEDRIGEYVAPYLLFQVDTQSLLLDPLARFVPGCEGALDLYVRPYYDGMMIARLDGGRWQIRPSDPDEAPRAWSKANFLGAVHALLKSTP